MGDIQGGRVQGSISGIEPYRPHNRQGYPR
jgi:hypothetical protein